MLNYIGNRLLALLPTVAVPMVLLFLLLRLTPGDPAAVILGEEASVEQINALREQMGLNAPLYVQFIAWLGRMGRLDFGQSIFLHENVTSLVFSAAIVTFQLALLATVVALLIGPALGALSASTKSRSLDKFLAIGSSVGIAIPTFWFAIVMIMVFAVQLDLFPVSGYEAPTKNLNNFISYMILPVISLGILEAATLFRYSRNGMLDAKHLPFVTTARAQGLSDATIARKYTFRVGMVPVITVVGLSLASLLGGAVVTETIFGLPGLGKLLLTAVTRRDYPLIEGSVFLIAIIFVIVNLLVDIVSALLDPRIRFERKA